MQTGHDLHLLQGQTTAAGRLKVDVKMLLWSVYGEMLFLQSKKFYNRSKIIITRRSSQRYCFGIKLIPDICIEIWTVKYSVQDTSGKLAPLITWSRVLEIACQNHVCSVAGTIFDDMCFFNQSCHIFQIVTAYSTTTVNIYH